MAFFDFVGNFAGFFQLGIGGNRLKNAANGLQIRNPTDTSDAQITTAQLNNSGDRLVLNSAATKTGASWLYNLVRPPSGMTQDMTLTLPATAPTPGQILTASDDTGVLVFSSAAAVIDRVGTKTYSLAFNTVSPLDLLILPEQGLVERITVYIDTAFNGTPSLSIGTAASPALFVTTSQIDLTDAAGAKSYIINPVVAPIATETQLQATYTAGGATAGAARIVIEYSIPS